MVPEASPVWVVIAAYNEATAIGEVLRGLGEYPYRLVVVDDGSKDGTAQQALKFPVTVLRHAVNLGQGAALQTGMRYALQQGAGFIVTFDADGQHNPADIEKMVAACRDGKCAVALGTRFAVGGEARAITFKKRWLLRVAIWLTRWMTGLKVTDTHNGLRAFTRQAAEKIEIRQNGMAHASEILNQIASQKLSFIEVPVTIVYTPYSLKKGQSLWNGINILWELLSGKLK